jgi:hypothetical protein
MRRILAIPLLAAFWVGSPAYALAQDPDTRVTTMPVSEPRERTVAPRFKEVLSGSETAQAQATPIVVAEQRGQRGGGSKAGGGSNGGGNRDGGGNRGGSNGGGDRGNGGTSTATRSGGDSNRGSGERGARGGGEVRNWGGDGRSTRSVDRVVFVPQRRPSIAVNYSPYRRGYIYPAFSYDPWIRHYYGWSPIRYAPWAWIYGTSGFAALGFGYNGYYPYTGYGYNGPDPYFGYGSGYGSGYASGYYSNQPSTFDMGSVRLKVRPRDAQVFVDGSYAGVVNDFDGVFQELRLSQGGHKIEVRMPGFESAFFDVYVQPGRTIDLREDLRPRP